MTSYESINFNGLSKTVPDGLMLVFQQPDNIFHFELAFAAAYLLLHADVIPGLRV
jgi:hypothetical protein